MPETIATATAPAGPNLLPDVTIDRRVTVEEFYEEGHSSLKLKWETSPALGHKRTIRELALNRPGLALAGFTQHFANKRMQVLGLAEIAYLRSLPLDLQRPPLAILRTAPAIILSRKRHCPPFAREMAESVGVPVLRTDLVTGHFINAATVLLQELAAPRLRVHGTMVDINGVGVLIEGEPGIGKSEIALSLIMRGYSLVSDDTTILYRDAVGRIHGTSVTFTRDHMEIRGLGIINISQLYGIGAIREQKEVQLVVKLEEWDTNKIYDRLGTKENNMELLGVKIPLLEIPVKPGRNVPIIIETAAMNERLKFMGYNSARDFNQNVLKWIENGQAQSVYDGSDDSY
jgi:HPr kinase/phosphorylase